MTTNRERINEQAEILSCADVHRVLREVWIYVIDQSSCKPHYWLKPRGGTTMPPPYYDVSNAFSHHPPFGDQAERYEKLRTLGGKLAYKILLTCPDSRERSLALTKIEEAVMWANASIARNEKPVDMTSRPSKPVPPARGEPVR